MAGVKAFREAYVTAGPEAADDFCDFDARRLRYQILWAFYENTAYRNVHSWAVSYRKQHGLYKFVRNVYNPAYRLGEFWKTHLWGGLLDLAAGDGKAVPSALPICVAEENAAMADALRAAIGALWRSSNWQVKKDQVALFGAVFGDVGIRVVDDRERQKVYLDVVQPSTLRSVERDPFGNVKGYEIQELRPHPSRSGQSVTYLETAERDGDDVVYRTCLNGRPYAWYGERAEWREPYGFIPMVVLQHNDVGLEWGWSELHPARSKIHEADDLASALSDRIRQAVNAPWFFAGLDKPKSAPSTKGADASTDRPEPGREEIPALYAKDPGARAVPLVADMDIAGVLEAVRAILGEMERDYPELQMDIWSVEAPSGRALRIARQRAEAKVQSRRATYDDVLVRAQMMAVAIAGEFGYPAFEGFDLDSYAAGRLAHSIDKRPVFATDPADDLELDTSFWQAAVAATKAGCPLPVYLKRQGWADEDIALLEQSPQWQSRLAQMSLGLELIGGGNG